MQFGFQKYLMYSLTYENDEWCRFVVHIAIGSPSLILLRLFRFFLFFIFFLSFFVTVLLAEVLREIWRCLNKAVELFLGS